MNNEFVKIGEKPKFVEERCTWEKSQIYDA